MQDPFKQHVYLFTSHEVTNIILDRIRQDGKIQYPKKIEATLKEYQSSSGARYEFTIYIPNSMEYRNENSNQY